MSMQLILALFMVFAGWVSCASRPPFEWAALPQSSSDTFLKFIEDQRFKDQGVTKVRYRVETSGFPVGKPLELWIKHFGTDERPAKFPTPLVVDEHGKVRWQADGSESRIYFHSLALAESKYLALFDPTSGQVAFAKIIPFPVIAEGAGGCRLSLEIASRDAMVLLATAEGFEPGEELATTSKSNGEVIRHKHRFLKDGPIAGLQPAVIGKDSGDASFTVEGAKCEVTLNYKWGKAARVFQ